MARWTSKEIVLGIDSSQEAIVFLEALQKQIKIVDIYADYLPGKVTIKLEGTKEHLKDALDMTQNIHLFVKDMLYPDKNGHFSYDLAFLTKITGKTFSIKTLMRILKLREYNPTQINGTIKTNIEYKTLLQLIEQINKTYNNMPYEVATTSLRDVLTSIALVKQISVEDTIKLARKIKVITEDNLKRLKLTLEPEQAIEKCLKKTK